MWQFLKDYGQLISITLIPFIIWFVGVRFQNRSSKRKAKLDLFLQLMSERRKNPPTVEFANALNLIDVVFQNDKKVRAAWRAYYDSLHPGSQHNATANSFLLDLLSEIAETLGYRNLRQTEIDRFYIPQYFANQLETQQLATTEYLRVLKNSENFGIRLPNPQPVDPNPPQNAEIVP